MIRALKVTALGGLLALLAACNGGGGGNPITTPVEQLALQLFAVSPQSGPTPLQATLTTVIKGGTAPYDYAWDFENDGSFDAFNNDTFDTTLSRLHTYNLRAADAGGSSVYQATVRVTDANGTVITSDPISVTVNSTSTPIDLTKFVEDELGNEVDPATHVFQSGERLRFHFGDSSTLTYQWDFNYQKIDLSKPLDQQVTPASPTFTVDSTSVNPSHIFYNTGANVIQYIVYARAVDPRTGAVSTTTFNISVAGTEPAAGDSTLVADISSNPPVDSTGTITVRFDPTGGTPGVPLEPRLDLSAVVSQLPGESGVPPYEYYWDFENDGKIDKSAQSPTIPYYDAIRKVTVNPYLHNEDEHTYQVRLLVIDIKGHSAEVIKNVRSINVGNRPAAALSFTVTWGFDNPLQTFEEVGGPTTPENGTWNITPKGATGVYEYKLDVNGDGLGDYDYVDTNADSTPDTAVLTPGANKWIPVTTSGTTIVVPFGPHPDNNQPPNTVTEWPVPNYYPAKVIVRALDAPGGSQVDIMTRQTPVSLVQVGSVDDTKIDSNPSTGATDPLPLVQDHAMAGFAKTAAGGGNGQYLVERGVVVSGGARGTTALRDTFRIVQTFDPPAAAGDLEASTGFTFDNLTPMTVARRGHSGFLFGDDNNLLNTSASANLVFYAVGGRNPADGPLATSEFMPFDDTTTNNPWLLSGTEIRPSGTRYPLYDFGNALPWYGGLNGVDGGNPHRYISFAGGLNQPSKDANANVNPMTLLFAPFSETEPADDGWGTWGATMSVPRYDLSTVIIGTTLYAIGGRSSSGQSTATLEKYDFTTDQSWVQLPNMQDARAGCCAEVIDPDGDAGPKSPEIYVYGGAYFPGVAGNRTLVSTAEVYNPTTQTWIYTVPPAAYSYAAASARLPGPGSVKGAVQTFNSVWYYGGEIGQTISAGETNKLEEFIYHYNVP